MEDLICLLATVRTLKLSVIQQDQYGAKIQKYEILNKFLIVFHTFVKTETYASPK